jgi:trk system potassium uptake protein TrkA
MAQLATARYQWSDVAVHIVVVGCGRVGSGLATQLSEEGHSVVVIDRNRDSFRRLGVAFTGTTIVGSGFDRECLLAANAGGADAFAAVTNGDNSNILCARIAREKYGITNVVARIYDPRRAVIYQRLGIPTVATVTWTTQQVKRWLLPQDDSVGWRDETDSLFLVERILPDHLAGRPLHELNVEHDIRVVGVIRGGHGRLDAERAYGQEDDRLALMVTAKGLKELDALLGLEGA